MINLIKLTNKELKQIHGGFSHPSKMPCYGYSIPAKRCITGRKLRKVKRSICALCYALKGRYVFPNVIAALERRFACLSNPLWTSAMAAQINKSEKSGFFRWHDSGDIQSVAHLRMICEVCEATKSIQHWLPTREYSIVADYLQQYGSFPVNLNVRLSAYMIESNGPVSIAQKLGLTVSGTSKTAFNCPASLQKGSCGDCRLCWNKSVFSVNYKTH